MVVLQPARAHVEVLATPPREYPPTVDIAVPVHNEEADLELSVRCLDAFLEREFPFQTRITIVDNASTDATWEIAQRLSEQLPRVLALHLDEKGRGRALRAAWTRSEAPILAYMDVDLSTDLRALLPLVAPLLSDHSDISIGSRLHPGSRVRRGMRRELISRAYNRLLRTVLRNRFRDAQCGFKALRREAAEQLLGRVEDQGWFFDTELLVNAERMGMRINELPVDWNDDPDSRVDVVATAITDLRGIARLRRQLWAAHRATPHGPRRLGPAPPRRPLLRFAAIGAASTLAYALLYALLRPHLAPVPANALALLATAIANTEANRRLTFGVREAEGRVLDHLGGLAAFAVALGITTAAAAALTLAGPEVTRGVEVTILVAAGAVATLLRFVMLASLIGRRELRGSGIPGRRR